MDDQPDSMKNRTPSSASSGTFLASPKLENQYHSDASLKRILELFLPPQIIQATNQDFTRFGNEVISKKVFEWVGNAERNPPYLKGSGRDAFGHRTDELVTSEGWRMLQSMGFREGIVAIPYENEYAEYSRLVQFSKYHIWSASSAVVTCPSAMQDGAASLLKRHLSSASLDPTTNPVFQAAFSRLTSRDNDAWTSGQWMTERIGGSDVSGTETLARRLLIDEHTSATELNGSALGPWVLDGFKWFSSATDGQMSIALARSEKGLSAFYVPMRRITPGGDSELNGISISRLKNKLGTKAVPTAELELRGVRAHLIGIEGDGVRTISTLLNITRVHNAVSSVGFFGRGLSISRSFAIVRELVGKGNKKTLKDVALHVRTLADITLSYRANMLFTFFTVYCLGISEQNNSSVTLSSIASDRLRPRNSEDLHLMLRLLTPALKALTAKASIAGLQECMESLGGIGYLDNEESQHINVSRLYRDANVLSIWEGTTNVLGTDFVRILKSRSGTFTALENWVRHVLFISCKGDSTRFIRKKKSILEKLQFFMLEVQGKDSEELFLDARNLMTEFSSVIIGSLMIVDAESDENEVSVELLRRYGEIHGFSNPSSLEWTKKAALDSKIVFGQTAVTEKIQARL